MDQKAHTAHFIYSCVHFLKFVCSSQKLCALLKDLVLTSLKLYVLLKVVRVVLKRSKHTRKKEVITRKKEVSIKKRSEDKKKEVSSEPSRMDQKAQRKAAFALSPSIIWSAIHSLTAGEYFYFIFRLN